VQEIADLIPTHSSRVALTENQLHYVSWPSLIVTVTGPIHLSVREIAKKCRTGGVDLSRNNQRAV